jgi:diguanylate cyclase (GGDEF)-like protein
MNLRPGNAGARVQQGAPEMNPSGTTERIRDRARPIRVLYLEDNPLDCEPIKLLLEEADPPCHVTHVQTREAFESGLRNCEWDVILSDFLLPSFDGLSGLEAAKKLCPATPFIFVTGTMGEENAVESLKHGATDYVLKQNLVRLCPAVRRALNERAETLRRVQVEAKLQQSEERLRFLAYHDALTGLPNRAFLVERLSDMLGEASRNGEKAGLLFIDLDHFKVVNESLGHSIGDQVLKSVADRLTNAARQQDIVARLGGDEFVVVLRNIKDSSDAGMAADRIRRLISQEIYALHHRLINTCSIGISVFPGNGADAETLIQNADAALYAAKERGRGTWQFFTADMNEKALERLTLENALRHASPGDELYVEYQPQVELATGMVVGAEALVRWRHPRLGLVPPSRFIPLAENTGEILRIGEWVLKSACAQAKQWELEGRPRLTMAVNVSAVQFRHPSFLETVHETLAESGMNAERLELEVTESQLMDNPEMMMVLLHKLREMGTGLAIDDFGIGYCGLSYLRHFHFTRLKIDQSFVRSVLSDPRDAALTASIVNMARVLKMKVIAECVETAEQMKLLHSLGCQQIQGYYFSPPVGAAEFARKFLGGASPLAHLRKGNRTPRTSLFRLP